MRQVQIDNITVGNGGLVLIAGPCVIESQSMCLKIAERIKEITQKLKIPFVFKASFDKANRTSINSFRGPGLEKGLEILKEVKQKIKVKVLTDIHCKEHVKPVAGVVDVIQIPAFLSRQTDLIVESANTGKVINIKKGQFLSPRDVKHVIDKVVSTKNYNLFITERGTSFGYNNLVSDMRALPVMRRFGYPIIFDATHSVQQPGGKGGESSGNREFVSVLSRAAVAAGCDGLYMEVHFDPDNALSDGPNMITPEELIDILTEVKAIQCALEEVKGS